MKPGTLVFIRHDLSEATSNILPGWGIVAWVEEDRAKVVMEPSIFRSDPMEQLVPLKQLQRPEEVPTRWAAHILGLELGLRMIDKASGRLRSQLYARGKDGRLHKLQISTGDCDDPEVYEVDRGSAIGAVYLEPDDFRFMRFEGIAVPPTDVEAEQDAIAMDGQTWGPIFARTWPYAAKQMALEMAEPDDYKLVSIEALKRVHLPERIALSHFDAPVGLFKIDDKVQSVLASTQNIVVTTSTHPAEDVAEAIQRYVDRLPKPSVLIIYTPPFPRQIDDSRLGWVWRIATVPGTEIRIADFMEE